MAKLFTLLLIFFSISLFAQSLPPNAILKDFRPFDTPRTNGRPGEVYRIDKNGRRFIVEDVRAIKAKTSEEGNLVGRMYFTSNELLTLLNLEFDRIKIIPVEVSIDQALREYNEQSMVDKVLYENGKIRDLVVDENSKYFIIRETISTKKITFRFSPDIFNKIKKGALALRERKSQKELDFPYEVEKKFKKPKRIFYLDQRIKIEPYEN